MAQKTFYNKTLRAARVLAGYDQRQLARAVHVTQPFISDFETGRREPSPEVAARIARVLGHDPHTLFPRMSASKGGRQQ